MAEGGQDNGVNGTSNPFESGVNQSTTHNTMDNTVSSMLNVRTELISGCIGLLKNFTGVDPLYSAEHFFEDVEDVARMGNWGPQTKLVVVKSKLRDRASEFLAQSYELRAETDFDNFKRMIIARFQAEEPLITRMNKFMTCKQLPGQDVRQYAACLRNAAARYFGTEGRPSDDTRKFRDETTMYRFIAGLKENLKPHVLRAAPKTLDQAVDTAITEEQNLILLCRGPSVNAVSEVDNEQSTEQLTRVLTRMMDRLETTERRVERMADEFRRNVSRGHNQGNYVNNRGRETFEPVAGRRQDIQPRFQNRERNQHGNRDRDLVCFFCGYVGHRARNCRRNIAQQESRNSNTVPKQPMGEFSRRNTPRENKPSQGDKSANLN